MSKGLVFITFDLFCSAWILKPKYRLYLNQELLTERTYVWQNPDFWIRENIPVTLNEGLHFLVVQPLDERVQFDIKNFQINNQIRQLRSNGKFHIDLTDLQQGII